VEIQFLSPSKQQVQSNGVKTVRTVGLGREFQLWGN
jgi:hypothetical protein